MEILVISVLVGLVGLIHIGWQILSKLTYLLDFLEEVHGEDEIQFVPDDD
jgi:hypothetical protein